MVRIVILVCSIYVPPDRCSHDKAIDVIFREVPFGSVGLGGQIEAIQGGVSPDIYHYEKITVRR